MVTIQDSEDALEAFLANLRQLAASSGVQAKVLSLLAPVGFRPVVELQEDGRKKRRTASAESWNPETGEIRVYFERIVESAEAAPSQTSPVPPSPTLLSDRRLEEILHALEEVEATPGHSFVALKWFRDQVLPAKGYSWSLSPDQRQEVLAKAIADGWILTSQVTNPHQPLYPTKTIRVNRQKRGPSGGRTTSRFRPVEIRGEPLSATISRDRGIR